MRKALLVSTVSRQFTLFDRDNIALLNELGYEVHTAANYSDASSQLDQLPVTHHHIDIQRSPFSFYNSKACMQLLQIMRKEKFDLVHAHAPMGGLIGRLCARLAGVNSIIYTAHGFHFYKGAPMINRLVYYNIERIAARLSDILITMNEEDYEAARRFRLRQNGRVIRIPGVGVDVEAIQQQRVDRQAKREQLGIPPDAFVMLSIGELIPRKNHQQALYALSELLHNKERYKDLSFTNIRYVIAGKGIMAQELNELAHQLGITEQVVFLGYRDDITELLYAADIFVFPSLQEGLPKSMMEAMAAGLPIIATDIRGNRDLVSHQWNGLLVDCGDVPATSMAMRQLIEGMELRAAMSDHNLARVKAYDRKEVNSLMAALYTDVKKQA